MTIKEYLVSVGVQDQLTPKLNKILNNATKDIDKNANSWGKAGRQSANLAQDWFTNTANGWDDNAKITVEGGWMKNKKTGKVFKVKGKGSSRPLIDSGQLRKAITYTIRKSNG